MLRERPGLPVVELSEHHIESMEAGLSWASQQIQALGQPGDVAIVFGATLNEQHSQRIGHAADQRQVKVIWLGRRGPGISIEAAEEELETRVTLNGTLAVCLARLIDIYVWPDGGMIHGRLRYLLIPSLLILALGGCGSIMSSAGAGPIAENPGERTLGQQMTDESIETKAKVNITAASEGYE